MLVIGSNIAAQTRIRVAAQHVVRALLLTLAVAGAASTSTTRAATIASAASVTTVRVHGQVSGRKGAPLVGAQVALEASRPDATRRTRTNATGAFAFDDLETGSYRLRVRYRETDASGQVDVQEDKQVDIALDIDP